jgi:hypothetical protein
MSLYFAALAALRDLATHAPSTVLPSLDGSGVVQLGIQTRRFTVRQASEFIEYLFAWGAENGVVWSEHIDVPGWMQERAAA